MLDYKAIGRRIAYYRKRAYLTQAMLAEALGISESYMSQVECGKVKVSLERLNSIAEIINIDITMLLADSNPNMNNYGCSELVEIIRNWDPKQKELLLSLVKCADDQFVPIKKEVIHHK